MAKSQAASAAVAAIQHGQWREAERQLRLAQKERARHGSLNYLLGKVRLALGDANGAADLAAEALRERPRLIAAHHLAAKAYVASGKDKEAAPHFREVLDNSKGSPELYLEVSELLWRLGRKDKARQQFEAITERYPAFAPGWNARGFGRRSDGDYRGAFTDFKEAVRLDGRNPLYLFNLGAVCRDLEELEQSEAYYRQAIALSPGYASAYYNLGLLLLELSRPYEAIGHLRHAIDINKNWPKARSALGMALLSLGEFEEGWKEHSFLWQMEPFKANLARISSPVWDGSSLSGKTLLVIAEQGLGDTFQFIRYTKILSELGARVWFECETPLVPVAKTLPWIKKVIARGQQVPQHDCHAALMALPGIIDPDGEQFEWNRAYISPDSSLEPPPYLDDTRTAEGNSPHIIVAWCGNPKHQRDRYRSCSPAYFDHLARDHDLYFVSLHVPDGSPFGQYTGERIVLRHEPERDLAGSMALVAGADLVLTVDTALAHMAGAMGVETWLLLDSNPDWRWLRSGEKTRWYPTMRLFRQTDRGDWDGVFERVSTALADWLNRKGSKV